MPFTKIARAEIRQIAAHEFHARMIYRGWYEANVSASLLDDLDIPHEEADGYSAYTPGNAIYAPVWVFGLWVNAGMPITDRDARWPIVFGLLSAARDSRKEQELVSGDLALSQSPARSAALNFLEVVRGERKGRVGDEHS